MKVQEHAEQAEKSKALDYDNARTQSRGDDLQKLIDARSYDLRNKQMLLEETEAENARFRDQNGHLNNENGL